MVNGATDGGDPAEAPSSSRVLTVPNAISVLRLACLPVFLWLLFGAESRLAAAALLGVLGATDWVDGWVARRFQQVSELGKFLDPTADRILLGVAAVAIYIDGAVPGILFWPVIARELVISLVVIGLAAARAERIEILWVGKAGAFALMFAFPLFLLGEARTSLDDVSRALAWFAAVPGLVLSYYAALEYARRVPNALRRRSTVVGEKGVSP